MDRKKREKRKILSKGAVIKNGTEEGGKDSKIRRKICSPMQETEHIAPKHLQK